MQSAFVFTKPHANTPAVREAVSAKFASLGISIVVEGDMDGATIDAKKHIDQHYCVLLPALSPPWSQRSAAVRLTVMFPCYRQTRSRARPRC